MYHKYSFCDDVTHNKNELEFLDKALNCKHFVVRNATTMPFSFALSKNRKVTALFSNIKNFFMFAAWETEKDRFLKYISKYIPFDEDLFNFALHNKLDSSPWQQSHLQFILCFTSHGFCRFDGPFDKPDELLTRRHVSRLMATKNKNITAEYQIEIPNESVNLYEFPTKGQEFLPNSFIITDKRIDDYNLLFEDKLKIYGV